jgi:RNA polymerase sigma-70 factor (family 1)
MNLRDLENLVVLFNRGDTNAFEVIYHKLSPGLHRYTRHFVVSREDAEDIVAESFLKLWTRRGSFETTKKLVSFLYVSSKNAGIDRLRHFKMIYSKRDDMIGTMVKEQEHLDIQDDITEALLNRIYKEIEKLPGKSREIIRLAYIEGLKNAEIARRLGTHEKTIRNQKTTALNRLRLKIFHRIRF